MRSVYLKCTQAVFLLLLLPSSVLGADRAVDTIVIASKPFTENHLLGEIMAQLIEAKTDLRVERKFNLGSSKVLFSALVSGEIDVYPEYTGTGWAIHLGRTKRVSDPLRAYVVVKNQFRRKFGVSWLMPFGFNNSYAIAMDEQRAAELGIQRISDLIPYQDKLSAAVSYQFMKRDDGYVGLSEAYGLKIGDIRTMDHGLAYEAIRSKQVDLVDTWTTDGKLRRFDVRVLEDDLRFFPPYDGAPIVNTKTLRKHPELERILNKLAFRLSDRKMSDYNYKVEGEGRGFDEVAAEFLQVEGLLAESEAVQVDAEQWWSFGRSELTELLHLTLEHLALTAIAVALAVVVSIPLGILLTRRTKLAEPTLAAAAVIQTIPSLALLAFFIPIPGLGLGARSAILALFLYAVLPILRNTYTGIKEVDADLVDAGRGIGLTDFQLLSKVQLPLATRTIVAGVRTATVISIGIATLAAFVGAGGLGEPIVAGLALNDSRMILSGAIPAAVLALAADFVLYRVEMVLAPSGIAPTS